MATAVPTCGLLAAQQAVAVRVGTVTIGPQVARVGLLLLTAGAWVALL
jgi:hypothetical protein